ncbi:hypothetical protein ACLESD_03265 [Pyxidicoccus sp. 3LFB2]
MNRPSNAGLVVLVVACLFATTCIQFDDARDEFCLNADPDQQRDICGTGDGGTRADGGPDGGFSEDAGTDAGLPACVAASDCPPQPGVCLSPGASCVEGRCVYGLQADGTACSGTPGAQCRESTGQCVRGVCEFTPRTSGACEDGNACTENDLCNSAGVCAGTSRTCTQPPSSCHEPTGTCSNGTCAYVLKPPTSSCDDGNACTSNDSCNAAGTCSGEPRVCNQPPSQCHEPTGTCSNGTCSYVLKPASSACNDGNACTSNDRCSASGACTGDLQTCNQPPTQCHEPAGTCSNGICGYPYKPVNASCSDGNACTLGDACNGAGVCNAGGPGCEDRSFECYDAVGCDPTFGCQYNYRCTFNQECYGGQCCRIGEVCQIE